MRKKFPVGMDIFEKIRTNDFYDADKTMLIAELWACGIYFFILENRTIFDTSIAFQPSS